MGAAESGKLRQVVFERLISGESRDALLAELRRKLDEDEARNVVRDAVDLIVAARKGEAYEATARRIRSRRIGSPYVVWRNFGFLLLIGGGVFTLIGVLIGMPVIASGPIVGGFVVLVVVEPKIRARFTEASAAVDRLLVESDV